MDRNPPHLRFVHHKPRQQSTMPMRRFVNHALALSPIDQMQAPQHPPLTSQIGNLPLPATQPPIQVIRYRLDPPRTHNDDLIVISSDEEDTSSEEAASVKNLGRTIDDAISLVDDDNDGSGDRIRTILSPVAATSVPPSDIEATGPAVSVASVAPAKSGPTESASFTAVTAFGKNHVVSKQEHDLEHDDHESKDDQRELKLESQVLTQGHAQQELGHEFNHEEQEHTHERNVDADLDEHMTCPSDNESISSSELLFGQQAANPVGIDIELLHALNAPDTDEEDPPDWRDLERLSISDHQTAESRPKSSALLVETLPPTITTINTCIPEDSNLAVLLSQIQVYKESVHSKAASAAAVAAHARAEATQTSSTRLSQKRRKVTVEQKIRRPYVPCRIWSNTTWEDWAQFEIGDWLHWPFEGWETEILDERLKQFNQGARKRRPSNETPSRDAFEFVAEHLPCRRAIDCKRYWKDRSLGLVDPYDEPVIISKRRDHPKKSTTYDVIGRARYQLRSRSSSARTVLWSGLDCEKTFGEGSADCLVVKIINKRTSGVKVVAGSACNDQPEYNIPGNLRLWSSDNGKVKQLRGHRAEIDSPSGAHQMWYTVTDVCLSNDHRFIFSSSHDKTARVWDAQNGKMLSTLVFHDQKIHQMAVSPDPTENILGTASADGSAVVWRLSGAGNIGSGQVCDLDMRMASNSPQCSIDTLAFGMGPSKGMLFTGVVTGLVSPGGFVQVFDSGTGTPIMRFESMRSAVCDINVSSSGKYIASANYSVIEDYSGDGYVHINDVRQPQSVIKAKTNHSDVNVVRMSPCERYIASGNPTNETAVLDIRRPDRVLYSLCHKQTLAEHLVPINSDTGISGIHWMSNSKYLVTGGGDCSVKIWDVWGSGDIVRSYPTSNNVASLAVDEDAMLICAGTSGSQGLVHIFSASPL